MLPVRALTNRLPFCPLKLIQSPLSAHDNGVIVFKLERERPAFSLYQNTLFYVRDKVVRQHDLVTGTDSAIMNVKKLGPAYAPPLTLSYNPAEKAILVNEVRSRSLSCLFARRSHLMRALSQVSDGGIFDFFRIPEGGGMGESTTDAKRGQGTSMLFVARNRFAVFNKATQVSLHCCYRSQSPLAQAHADPASPFRPSTFATSPSASPSR